MGPGKRGAGSGRYLGERKGEGQKTLACGDVRGLVEKQLSLNRWRGLGFAFLMRKKNGEREK